MQSIVELQTGPKGSFVLPPQAILESHYESGMQDDQTYKSKFEPFGHTQVYLYILGKLEYQEVFYPFFFSKLVGTAGFEPTTTCAPCKCATRLRYAPFRVHFLK
jgi:hypothetical protein